MIVVTRLNGSEIVVNADLIETVEATPDTIVTLVDGTRYLVEEAPSQIVHLIKTYRAAVLRFSDDLVVPSVDASAGSSPRVSGAVVDFPTERTE